MMPPGRANADHAFAATLRRFAACVGLCVAIGLGAPRAARAGDIEDFQAARELYEAHDWPRAVDAFEALVGRDPPALSSRPLVLESRNYLAAAYVFVGRERSAIDQLERLLRDEPGYELDEARFPREVVQLFERVRARLREEHASLTARTELERELARLSRENEALRAHLGEEETLAIPRSEALVFLPFGVGQFENGDDSLGYFFLISEALTAVGAITATVMHLGYIAFLQDNAEGVSAETWRGVNDALHILAPTSWAFASAFGVLAIAGVVQARLEFTPTRSVRVPPRAPQLQGELALGLGAIHLSLRF